MERNLLCDIVRTLESRRLAAARAKCSEQQQAGGGWHRRCPCPAAIRDTAAARRQCGRGAPRGGQIIAGVRISRHVGVGQASADSEAGLLRLGWEWTVESAGAVQQAPPRRLPVSSTTNEDCCFVPVRAPYSGSPYQRFVTQRDPPARAQPEVYRWRAWHALWNATSVLGAGPGRRRPRADRSIRWRRDKTDGQDWPTRLPENNTVHRTQQHAIPQAFRDLGYRRRL